MLASLPRRPFSLDPLIAEAKRRARKRRALVTAAVLLLALSTAGLTLWPPNGHGSGSPAGSRRSAAKPPRISLTADRVPLLGEIYRVDPNGHRVDLTPGRAYQIKDLVVSPDGKRVAFDTYRGGVIGPTDRKVDVYEVGIDGQGLARVGRFRQGDQGTALAWQPHGTDLAVATGFAVRIVAPTGGSVLVPSANRLAGWSPDGRVLVATGPGPRHSDSYRYLAVSPRGHLLWTVENGYVFGGTWSTHRLLAVPTGGEQAGAQHGIAVYDEAGKLRFSVPLGPSEAQATWSPNGRRIALVSGPTVQIRTATGRRLITKNLPTGRPFGFGPGLPWDGNGHVLVVSHGVVRLLDARTGKTSRASSRFARPTSADGTLAILTPRSRNGLELQVAPTAGGPARTYRTIPDCRERGQRIRNIRTFGFVPHSRSLVYASMCPAKRG